MRRETLKLKEKIQKLGENGLVTKKGGREGDEKERDIRKSLKIMAVRTRNTKQETRGKRIKGGSKNYRKK